MSALRSVQCSGQTTGVIFFNYFKGIRLTANCERHRDGKKVPSETENIAAQRHRFVIAKPTTAD